MNKYDIKIVQISKDRQSCKDAYGNYYTIKKIRELKKTINVHIVRNSNARNNGYSEIIRYRRNCKPSSGLNIKSPKISILHDPQRFGNSSKIVHMCIIMEDRGSAKDIIKNIVKAFAINNNITIDCDFISTFGASNITYALNYELKNYKKCLLIYDSALEQSNVE